MKIGTIIMVTHLEASSHAKVAAAARDAGIPDDCVRKFKDWAAFRRAIRTLVNSGKAEEVLSSKGDLGILRDEINNDESVISFQLSEKWLARKGINYTRAQIIRFHKADGKIDCESDKVRGVVTDLLRKAKVLMSTTDCHKIAARYCAKFVRRIMIRDGVYYVPVGHDTMLMNLKTFYSALGASLWCNHVTEGIESTENILRSTVDDIMQSMEELKVRLALHKKKRKQGGISKEVAQSAIEEIKERMYHYCEIARSIHVDAMELMRKAGKAGDILRMAEVGPAAVVAMAREGQPVDKLALELATSVEPEEKAKEKPEIKAVPASRPMPVVISRRVGRSKVINLPARRVAVVAQR